METTMNKDVLREFNDNSSNIPEGVGVAEDSSFASIAGSVADGPIKQESDTNLIAQDVKFREINVEEMAIARKAKKRKIDPVEVEARKKAEDEYNEQKREQTYKRLMHLLTKSKFYSSYIVDKINSATKNESKNKKKATPGKKKNKENETQGTSQGPKRSQRVSKMNRKYDIRDYVSTDMKKKLNDQTRKMNLSQEEIKAELDSQSDSEEKQPDEAAESAAFVNPTYFNGTLREYQIEGLQWLKVLYENGVNGILADEMGLGKTIQVIALFAHLLEKRQAGPYLIIVPLSTMPNWIMEFERFAPTLPVIKYHGTAEARIPIARKINRKHPVADNYSTYPIVLTTYETPLYDTSFFRRFKWRYIVIDEGHRIKNHKCQLLGVLNRCDSMNRLLLTGTPLQNNLSELWSLLNFLLPEIFDDLAVFESWFDAKELQADDGTDKVLKQEEDKHVLSSLREILKPFMLRRIKADVCADIPPKKELIVYAPLTELQHDLYGAVLNHDLQMLSKIEEDSVIFSEGPSKPKRRCVTRNKYSKHYVDIDNHSSLPVSDDFYGSSQWQEDTMSSSKTQPLNKSMCDKKLDIWRQYTTIDDRNRDYFIRIRFGNRGVLYKQIVNHPFLLHCPLDLSGRPEISENLVKNSGKLLVLDAMLKKLKKRGHKVLLFSTMTMILDLIADYMTMRPWQFLMLDGRHKIDDRQVAIKAFNEDPDIFIFLISTRAGGVGLNLAAADTVIVYDSDWNPQADLQAMARCHRIGQTRPVVVYRLCTKGTIDEKIINRAEAKRKLEKMVISKETGLDLKNMSNLIELKLLLDSKETTVVSAEKEVYTDAELDKILDRSDLPWPPTQSAKEEPVSAEESEMSAEAV